MKHLSCCACWRCFLAIVCIFRSAEGRAEGSLGGSSASADPGSAVSVVCCTAHTGLMSREKSRSTVCLEFLGELSQQSSAASRAVWGDQSCQGLVSSVPFCFAVSCECYLKFSRVRGRFITWSSFPGGPQCLGYIFLPDFWFLIWYMAPILREPQTQGTCISLVPSECLVVF